MWHFGLIDELVRVEFGIANNTQLSKLVWHWNWCAMSSKVVFTICDVAPSVIYHLLELPSTFKLVQDN
jgi:hypothetical protein